MNPDAILTAAGSERTRRRWQKRGIPARARALAGDLAAIDPAWAGWILRRGELVSPEGLCFRPGEVLSIPLRIQQVRALERDARPFTQREMF